MAHTDNGMQRQRLPQPHAPQQQSTPYFPPPPREEFPQYSDNSQYLPRSQEQFGQPTRHSDYPPPPVGQYASTRDGAPDQADQQDVASQSLVVSGHQSAHNAHSQLAPYDEHIARAHLPPPPSGPPPPHDHEYNPRRRAADTRGQQSDSEYDSDDYDDYENTRRHRRRKRSRRDSKPDARDNPLGSKGHRFTSEDKGV